MSSAEAANKPPLLMILMPVLVDAAAALVLLLWMPALAGRLETPSGWNALLLVLLYLLFCIGVYLSRKLLPQGGRWPPPAWLMDPRVRGLLGVLFALFMTTTFAYQVGYFAAIFELRAGLLEEGSTAAFLVYAPGAWLGFSMLVILVLAFPVQASVQPGSGRYLLLALLSLLFTNGLLVFSTAQTRAMIAGLGLTPGIGLWLLVIAAFLLSFFPARLLYQSRLPLLPGWLSFAALLLFCAAAAVSGWPA